LSCSFSKDNNGEYVTGRECRQRFVQVIGAAAELPEFAKPVTYLGVR
jgi:hypothetical protein